VEHTDEDTAYYTEAYYLAGYAAHINMWIINLKDEKQVLLLDAYIFNPYDTRLGQNHSVIGCFEKEKIDYMLLKDIVKPIPVEELDKYL